MIYIAGPWFTVRQGVILENIKNVLTKHKLQFYSPKDEMPFKEFTPKQIFESNLHAINEAALLVVITDGKDVGTIFEAGYAVAAGTPVVYVWVDHDRSNFNIMLAQSGDACYLGLEQFDKAMEYYSMTRTILSSNYEGNME